MADFSNLAITDSGRVLFADVQAGAVLVATKIVIGSGSIPAGKTSATMTEVVTPVKELSINKRKRSNDGKATFGGVYSNKDVTEAYYFRELSLFCKAEYRDDAGNVAQEVAEVLYAYGNSGDSADLMPAYSTNAVVEKQIDIVIWVGNEVQVDLTLESGIYMTQEQLDEALSDICTNISDVSSSLSNHISNTTGNPHKVSASQIGAVPTSRKINNKSLSSDITLGASDVGAVPVTRKVNGKTLDADITLGAADVGAATSGHTHTAADVGASASNHTHKYAGSSTAGGAANSAVKLSAARKVTVDLTSESGADFDGSKAITPGVSGILPITHGGTGAANADDARTNLGIITLDEIPNLYIWKKYEGDPSTPKETTRSNVQLAYRSTSDGVTLGGSVTYAESVTISDDGVVLGEETNTCAFSSASSDVSVLLGKYVKSIGSSLIADSYDGIYYIPEDATLTVSSTSLKANTAIKLTRNEFIQYVASKESDGYPKGTEHTDGYWYEYHKQLVD